jgi:hypothetical protein
MKANQAQLKTRIIVGTGISMIALSLITAVASVQQNWISEPLGELPVMFWILYALDVLMLGSIMIASKFFAEQSRQQYPYSQISTFINIGYGFFGLFIVISAIYSGNDWNGVTLLSFSGAFLLVLYGAEQLITYIRTRINKHQPSHNE